MDPVPASAERSTRRSRNRTAILLALASLGEAYAGQLARMTGIAHFRVKACLVGAPPDYRVELALVHLGLARVVDTDHGRYYAITSKGLRKARSITAARARRRGRHTLDLR